MKLKNNRTGVSSGSVVRVGFPTYKGSVLAAKAVGAIPVHGALLHVIPSLSLFQT